VSYVFEPTRGSQIIYLISQGQRHDIEFQTLSGDWFIASPTPDQSYLVIAEPYYFDVYRVSN